MLAVQIEVRKPCFVVFLDCEGPRRYGVCRDNRQSHPSNLSSLFSAGSVQFLSPLHHFSLGCHGDRVCCDTY
jgi:hypothetical protein